MYLSKDLSVKEQRSFYVAIRNDLIEKSENIFSVSENKALLFLLAKIKPGSTYDYENQKNNIIEFSIKEYCDVMRLNYNSGKNYDSIKNSFLKLGTPFWANKDKKTETMVRYIDQAEHDKKEKVIKVAFSKQIAPFIYELSKNQPYTKMRLFYQISFKNKYSFKIYQLCCRYLYKKFYVIKIDDLKELLNIKEKTYSNLKSKVLTKVKKELNDVSNINIDFEEIKDNKKVVKIKFIISKKTNEEMDEVNRKYENVINKINNIQENTKGEKEKCLYLE